ncbi:BlaI/MecI/CopY family transcriptional regulator [Planctomyces sp. SH-PL14]|uniref:BlaI/MecI/CopY family transcriptional regulator n=1 Tax=Planctomyces sp. SH-PL14 TaxID=1632864 RepID=UPI00078BC66E|nr:BlaI/MecI/CopY family transcriptional regulator [Planctomyces sp. SH-PL14]AMV20745.1 Penicillinase repressor [Planctomyces sp. SH-PL14]
MAKKDAPPLTDAQREIMEIVWAEREVTVSQVWTTLSPKRDVARNTVQTLIVRLEEKGWLTHREEGRLFLYSAARPRTTSLGASVARMIDHLFAGSPENMLMAMMEYRGLSDDEKERIRALIDNATPKPTPKRGRKAL